jgi:hypothetical protein
MIFCFLQSMNDLLASADSAVFPGFCEAGIFISADIALASTFFCQVNNLAIGFLIATG